MSYTGTCGPKGYGHRVLILVYLAILVINPSVDEDIFLRRSRFFIIYHIENTQKYLNLLLLIISLLLLLLLLLLLFYHYYYYLSSKKIHKGTSQIMLTVI